MGEEELKVFGAWGSPFIALELKGVPFQYIAENLSDEKLKSPLLLKYNPVHKKVPVLLHNGKPALDTLMKPGKTIPFRLPILIREHRLVSGAHRCMPPVWKALLGSGEHREKTMKEVRECLKTLENVLNRNRFFGGETIGLVDIAANFIAYCLRAIQEVSGLDFLSAVRFPLMKWCEEFVSCNVVKEHLPPRDGRFKDLRDPVRSHTLHMPITTPS